MKIECRDLEFQRRAVLLFVCSLSLAGGMLCAQMQIRIFLMTSIGLFLSILALRAERFSFVAGFFFGVGEAFLAFSALDYGRGAVLLALLLSGIKRAVVFGAISYLLRREKKFWLLTPFLIFASDRLGPVFLGTLFVPLSFAETTALQPLPAYGILFFGIETCSAFMFSIALLGVYFFETGRRNALIGIFLLILCSEFLPLPVTFEVKAMPPPEKVYSFRLLQTHIDNLTYEKAIFVPSVEHDIEKAILQAIEQAHGRAGELLVFGETAWRPSPRRYSEVLSRLQKIVDEGGFSVLIGVPEGDAGAFKNWVHLFRPHQMRQQVQKHLLVPLVEKDFQKGEGPKLLDWNGKKLGVLVCVESLYAEPARALKAMGAEVLVVVANDAGFRGGAMAKAHAERVLALALETNLPVVHLGQDGAYGFAQVKDWLVE